MFRCLLRCVGSQQQLCCTVRHLFTIEYRVQASLLTLCRAVMGTSALQYVLSHYMKLETPVCKQSNIDRITSRVFPNQHSSSPVPASLLFAASTIDKVILVSREEIGSSDNNNILPEFWHQVIIVWETSHEKAITFFGLFGSDSDDDDEDPTKVPPSVKCYLLKANRYRRSGAYQRAERACHQALEILAKSKHSSSQTYTEARAYVLDTMANIYLEQPGKLEQAEVTFKETMRIMLTAGMEQESEAIIEISLKLSKIYSSQRKYEVALVGFLWCVEKARERWGQTQSPESHALLGMCLHGLGQYYLIVGQHREAGEAFSEAVGIAKDIYGPEDIQVAVLQNDLGTALDGEGRYREAEEVVRQSLAIAKLNKNIQDIEEHLAIIQCNLAEVQSHQGNEKAAVELCNKAMTAAKRAGDKILHKIIQKRCSTLKI